ncbi:hypothetical protein BDA99DRAFT_532468 [Phascolomyces articulosus]|uniref:Uncharacterized protein n=1 Tax=Phascolomyces articulosus TaxID=60185 RepID=A0AAD5K9B6_9FUNG|nr:hypothetical protein BDA99DRAFT_532468 [Phascolomyces articulosus]
MTLLDIESNSCYGCHQCKSNDAYGLENTTLGPPANKLSRTYFAKISISSEHYGDVKSGSLKGIPLMGCHGDQQAAFVGQKCFLLGEAKNTYDTGCIHASQCWFETCIFQK